MLGHGLGIPVLVSTTFASIAETLVLCRYRQWWVPRGARGLRVLNPLQRCCKGCLRACDGLANLAPGALIPALALSNPSRALRGVGPTRVTRPAIPAPEYEPRLTFPFPGPTSLGPPLCSFDPSYLYNIFVTQSLFLFFPLPLVIVSLAFPIQYSPPSHPSIT